MIHQYVHPLMNYLHAHPHWGGLIAYLVAFVESLAIIGTIVPGSVTMTAIGVLIGTGVLPAWQTILWAVLGAFSGDCLSYWVGIHYNVRLRQVWPFYKYLNVLTKGEEFFKAHGGKSVVIGRFTGPVRSLVPMIAGLLKMKPLSFLPIAFISAILWALVYMLPGIILGALSLQLPPSIATKFIALCLIVVAILWFFTWLIKYFFNRTWDQIDQAILKLWTYMNTQKSSHWITQTLKNPEHEEDHQQLVVAILMIISGVLFLWFTLDTLIHGLLTHWNIGVYNLLQNSHAKFVSNVMVAITLLGDKYLLIPVALILFAWLFWQKQRWAAWHWLGLTIISAASVEIAKKLIYSPRPAIVAFKDLSSSFVSGHAVLSTALYGFLAVLIAKNLPEERRSRPYLVAAILIILIAFSRIYLGAHWLSDVVAGIFLGLAWLCLAILSFRRKTSPPFSAAKLTLVSGLVILFAWLIYSLSAFKIMQEEYLPIWPAQSIAKETWWNQTSGQFPFYVLSRVGHPSQPLNVQWTGSLSNIKQVLEEAGWQSRPPKWDLLATISRLTAMKNQRPLPLLPMLYHNRSPVLVLTKDPGEGQPIMILRLWQSDTWVGSDKIPLWYGMISYYQPPTSLISIRKQSFVNAIPALIADLDGFVWKRIQIPITSIPKEIAQLHWDGQVLLIKSK